MSDNNFLNSVSLFANAFSYMAAPLSRNLDDADVLAISPHWQPPRSGSKCFTCWQQAGANQGRSGV